MHRRQLLVYGTIGTGLLAGCLADSSDRREQPANTTTDSDSPSDTEATTEDESPADETNTSSRDQWCETTATPSNTTGEWTHVGFDAANTSATPTASLPTEAPCLRWEYQGSGQTAPVTVTTDLVVFPGTSSGSSVTAFDRLTGESQWSVDNTIVDDVSHSRDAAAISGDTVFFEAYESSRTNQYYLFAVDRDTGEERWRFPDLETADDQPDPERLVPGVTVVDGRVFVQSGRATYAVDADTGERLWRGGEGGSTPTVGAGLVFGRGRTAERTSEGSRSGLLYALDVASGEEAWSLEQGPDIRQPTYADGRLFVPLVDSDTTMTALDAATGSVEWTYESSATAVAQAVADGTVYCATDDAGLIALDAATGERDWTFNPAYTLGQSAPVVTDELVIHPGNDTGASDHVVFAVDRDSGDQQWRRQFADPIFRSPTVADDELWVVTQAGSLLAFRATDGE